VRSVEIVKRKLSDIHPYPNNPRKNDEAVQAVIESIKQVGYCDPIEVDENGVILSGHTRLKALNKLGWKEAEVVVISGLTEEQKKKYRLLANKTGEIALWDTDLLQVELNGMDFEGFDFGFDDYKEPGEVIEDEAPEVDEINPPTAKLGDVWQLGRHRVMCGDSTDAGTVALLMNGVQADMMITDPPYNVDYEGTAGKIDNDNMGAEQFCEFLTSAFKGAGDCMKQGAAFYIWHASRTIYEFVKALKNVGMEVRQQLIWNKNSLVMGRQDYQWKHEPCLYGWKDGTHYFTDDRKQTTVFEDETPNFRKMKKDDLVNLLNDIYSDKVSATVISENRPSSSEEHPTMKPIKLMARLIKNSSKPAETVVDIFGGSGSTLIACEQLERTCYMMELDPKYVDVIIKRWENLTGQTAVLL